METAATTVIQSPFVSHGSSKLFIRSGVLPSQISNFAPFGSNFVHSVKHAYLISHPTSRQKRVIFHSRRSSLVRAAQLSPESEGSSAQIAPLQLESPVGQFLSQILISHPHLVPAAVEQQLEQLQTDLDADKKEEQSASGTDIVLYRRIAEVKAHERRRALEEILYTLIVQKFMDANVPLIPTIGPSAMDPSRRVDTWPTEEDKKIEQLHSPDAYEMIQNHLSLILGNRLGDSTTVAQLSKLRVGQVYAASVMYGYFLKRVDQRFQLEKAVKILPSSSEEEQSTDHQAVGEGMKPHDGVESFQSELPSSGVSSWSGGISPGGFGHGIKASRLRSYVMSFDGETLQRYATIRSKEAVTIIEKHAEALFGRPEISITPRGTIDSSKDELIKITFGGLKRLVLEAVTFGSFLWDVESYVDSRYHIVMN